MHVVRRPRPGVCALPTGCVATIGVFDGLHVGHRRILDRVKEEAARRALPALVFSFEPTPQEMMSPGSAPARLMRFREKVLALKDFGIQALFCPPFDRSLQELAPEDFIARLLVRTLAVRYLVVGDDFRFGYRRAGGLAELEQAGRAHGFGVEHMGSVILDGVRISSTAVRTALAAGRLADAGLMLGQPYRMVGRVVRGRQLGRQLGFPTANLRLGRLRSPVSGIFAVRVRGAGRGIRDAVASLGTRPTVAGREPLLEVHLFDFSGDLYGCQLQVDFIARIRDEAHFPDLPSLRRQMEADAVEARRLLAAQAAAGN